MTPFESGLKTATLPDSQNGNASISRSGLIRELNETRANCRSAGEYRQRDWVAKRGGGKRRVDEGSAHATAVTTGRVLQSSRRDAQQPPGRPVTQFIFSSSADSLDVVAREYKRSCFRQGARSQA